MIHDFIRDRHDYSDAQVGAAADILSGLLGRDYAIVDSGASFTYVNVKTTLVRCRPGSGYVSVANGQREQIAQVGSLGPIRNAQKANRETGVIMLSGGEKGSARGLPTRAKKPPSPNPLLLDLWGPCVSVSVCHAPPSR